MVNARQDHFIEEINRQPVVMRDAARQALAAADTIFQEFSDYPAEAVIFSGMGTSVDTGWAASSVLARQGVLTYSLPASELLYSRWPGLPQGARLVAVSQSGESAETVKLCQLLRIERPDIRIMAITNQADSSLTDVSHTSMVSAAGEELAPSTMTYAATMVMHYALQFMRSSTQTGNTDLSHMVSQVDRCADEVSRLLQNPDTLMETLRWIDDRKRLMIVGRGTALTPAEVSCLVFKEAALLQAEAMESGEFRHGPIELAGPDLSVAIVSLEDTTRELDRILADELVTAGAEVYVVGGGEEQFSGLPHLPFHHTDLLLDAVPAAVPFQLGAWKLATASGRRPESMVIASKVTARE